MKRKVFIHTAVFEEGRPFKERDIEPDDVSRLCTQSIGKLLERVPAYGKTLPICFGSAYSVLNSLHAFNRICVEEGPLRASPSRFPGTVLNAPACYASITHQLTGPIYNFSNGATSALDALGFAYMQIADEREEEAVVCAAEEAFSIARVIDHALSPSSSGALYLSSLPGPVELLEYRICALPEKEDMPISAYGCVEALRLIYTYLYASPREDEREVTLTEFPYQASVRLRFA